MKKKHQKRRYVIALAGNPNVGKSTLFNALTGMRRHTGNWTGKTLSSASGDCRYHAHNADTQTNAIVTYTDLPGMYAWHDGVARNEEEAAAVSYLQASEADLVAVVCDAGALERNLILVLQLKYSIRTPMVVILNLEREAEVHGRHVDVQVLSQRLGLPVLCAEATRRGEVKALARRLEQMVCETSENGEQGASGALCAQSIDGGKDEHSLLREAADIAREAVTTISVRSSRGTWEARIDRIVTGKWTGYAVMLCLLCFIFWVTMVGANVLSDGLSQVFSWVEQGLWRMVVVFLPTAVTEFIIHGILRTVFWVAAVMLPPMAIFFPLFTILEDLGYLPRIAFNLDRAFVRCHACGKQALTMCMGLGCNAVGVTGSRIIDSPRERKIALLTNSLMPCNGRLPTLCTLITLFLVVRQGIAGSFFSALILLGCLLLCVGATLGISWLLSATLLRGEASSFVLELPPYRKPRWGQIAIRSVLDRTLHMLGRAVVVAAPAGAVLWLLANLRVSDTTILSYVTAALDAPGRFLGMDGVILTAFVLSLPANEIAVPIMVMIYRSGSSMEAVGQWAQVQELFLANGWTLQTVLCVMLFLMFHWPCATTLWTLKRESGSIKWTVFGALIPTILGCALCLSVRLLFNLIVG